MSSLKSLTARHPGKPPGERNTEAVAWLPHSQMGKSLLYFANLMIAGAWSLFLVSFFLSATDTLTGWQAFTASIGGLASAWVWLVLPGAFIFLVFPFANALMLMAPIIRFLLRDSAGVLALILIPFAILPWFMPSALWGELQIGFYCWNASFVIMSVGCILSSVAYAALDEEYYESLRRTHATADNASSRRDPFSP